jgi:hypothetical protein
LKDVLPSLQAQAAQGDAVAACRIAFELDRCTKLPWMRRADPGRGRDLDKRPPEQRDPFGAAAARWRDNVAFGETACEGIEGVDPSLTWSYAIASALAGNAQARYAVIHGFAVGLDFMRPDRTLEEWAEWRQHVATFEADAIRQGDFRVIAIASRDYWGPRNGIHVFPEDKVMSVALRMVLADRAAPGAKEDARRNMESLIRELGLTAQELTAANARSRELLRSLPPNLSPHGNDLGMAAADGSDCERRP